MFFKAFPRVTAPIPDQQLQKLYESGHAGVFMAPPWVKERSLDAIISTQGSYVDADDACHAYGLAESGKGKLSLTYPAIETLYPGSLPGPGQDWGDCVSHGAKNALLVTMCNEIVSGTPDEISNKVEEAPKLSQTGIIQGVLCPESIFWWRKHPSDGWFCEEATETVLKYSGTLLRKNYPELSLNMESYSLANSKKYGRTPPSGDIAAECAKHLVRTATVIKTPEAYRDLTANGYGINTCGSEGFNDNRDENGVSRKKGSWAHSMATAGVDDRPEIHSKYGEMLVLVWQSWGPGWGSGGRKIFQTDIEIPKGFFWVKWSEWKKRYMVAFSGHNGWPRQQLPDYGWGTW